MVNTLWVVYTLNRINRSICRNRFIKANAYHPGRPDYIDVTNTNDYRYWQKKTKAIPPRHFRPHPVRQIRRDVNADQFGVMQAVQPWIFDQDPLYRLTRVQHWRDLQLLSETMFDPAPLLGRGWGRGQRGTGVRREQSQNRWRLQCRRRRQYMVRVWTGSVVRGISWTG